ncbi:histone-lysine N-methyltransferase SETMAR [Nephila pilipes]|uniref:Histone-lysine N-methyltransferase SETMAR n=1 Tax=Nephila pilipes TaxID=299642 RepID=A0A8X6PKM1_NEPPI|nr:histone-lysine N-methyltransferase SETMAR [Nephila pilipes]
MKKKFGITEFDMLGETNSRCQLTAFLRPELDRDDASKHFHKSKLHQKKVKVTIWWLENGVIPYSFLNPGENVTSEKFCQEIDSMHQKLQHL